MGVARVQRLFQLFGATQARGHSEVYARLSEAAASDAELLELMLEAPADQRWPSLLFAAVNLLLARDPAADLAAYYAIHGGQRAVDAGLAVAFRKFWTGRREAISHLLRTRSTQTNEVRRCVALRLGLEHVAAHWPGPFALVEVGASAGLNLVFDRYGYSLGGGAPASGASPVILRSRVIGAAGESLFGPAPGITSRVGVDLQPVDLDDPESRAWLEAFIWPEQTDELATLRGAIELARSNGGVVLKSGDAVRDTARIIGDLPGEAPVVVFTASLMSYLDADARTAFQAQLQAAAARRPVAWVFAEGPGLMATLDLDVPALAGPLGRNLTNYVVGASLFGASSNTRLLALCDAYLRWVAPARGPGDDFQWVSGLPEP